MAKRHSRRLVIDADVARSAGESEHPTSSACRALLCTVLEVGNYVVMTQKLSEEWRRHRSRYSAIWLRQMFGRKRVYSDATEHDASLGQRIDDSLLENERTVARKDLHLIEAALATDRLVASRDEHAREAFRHASAVVRELKGIVWVNPTRTVDAPVDWLRSGARAEAHRQFGA